MKFAHTEVREFDAKAPMKVDSVRVVWKADDSPDLSYLEQYKDSTDEEEVKYAKRDAERLKAYYDGDWHMLGCYAVATVSYPAGQGSRRIERFQSGGLWGIESDSDQSYLDSVAADEISDLREHLKHFGITLPEDVGELLERRA